MLITQEVIYTTSEDGTRVHARKHNKSFPVVCILRISNKLMMTKSSLRSIANEKADYILITTSTEGKNISTEIIRLKQ